MLKVRKFVEVEYEEGDSFVDFVNKIEDLQKNSTDIVYTGCFDEYENNRIFGTYLPQVVQNDQYEVLCGSQFPSHSDCRSQMLVLIKMQESHPEKHFVMFANGGFIDAKEAIKRNIKTMEEADKYFEEESKKGLALRYEMAEFYNAKRREIE